MTVNQRNLLRDTVSIALTTWGGIYLLSGIVRMNIKATVKTIVGGYLLYKGINDYKETHENDYNSLLSDSDVNFDEADAFAVSQDPTLE